MRTSPLVAARRNSPGNCKPRLAPLDAMSGSTGTEVHGKRRATTARARSPPIFRNMSPRFMRCVHPAWRVIPRSSPLRLLDLCDADSESHLLRQLRLVPLQFSPLTGARGAVVRVRNVVDLAAWRIRCAVAQPGPGLAAALADGSSQSQPRQ